MTARGLASRKRVGFRLRVNSAQFFPSSSQAWLHSLEQPYWGLGFTKICLVASKAANEEEEVELPTGPSSMLF